MTDNRFENLIKTWQREAQKIEEIYPTKGKYAVLAYKDCIRDLKNVLDTERTKENE